MDSAPTENPASTFQYTGHMLVSGHLSAHEKLEEENEQQA